MARAIHGPARLTKNADRVAQRPPQPTTAPAPQGSAARDPIRRSPPTARGALPDSNRVVLQLMRVCDEASEKKAGFAILRLDASFAAAKNQLVRKIPLREAPKKEETKAPSRTWYPGT